MQMRASLARGFALAVLTAALAPATAIKLRGQPAATAKAPAKAPVSLESQIAEKDNEVQGLEKQLAAVEAMQAAKKLNQTEPQKQVAKNATAQKPITDAEQLSRLNAGMSTIMKLQGLFKSSKAAPESSKFADGAMSDELSKKDSEVWSTLAAMMNTTQQAVTAMKGKSKEERKNMMTSLEDTLNGKARTLSKVTDQVTKQQRVQNEEYLLGLLNMHGGGWTMERQLNATSTFANGSPVIEELLKHHDATKPLAPQLAALMDAEPAHAAVAKAATRVAAKLFLQLTSSFGH